MRYVPIAVAAIAILGAAVLKTTAHRIDMILQARGYGPSFSHSRVEGTRRYVCRGISSVLHLTSP